MLEKVSLALNTTPTTTAKTPSFPKNHENPKNPPPPKKRRTLLV